MSEITIPPSPGWYLGNIIACNDNGSVVAYGAKHEVTILRPVSTSSKSWKLQPSFIALAHKDRIVALAFSPSDGGAFQNHLVSCSDDGSVHIWDLSTESLMLSHSGHGDQKVVGVDWSKADPNLVVSAGDGGSLICWDVQSNTIRRLFVGNKVNPICVSCCPHSKDLVAVGAKNGLILIFNVKRDGTTTFRLKNHETDVVSLSWCPVPHNIFKGNSNNKTYLLASGAKDRSIYIWRAGSDGRYETFINLPPQPLATSGFRTKSVSQGGVPASWVCVRWVEENKLLTSSLYGELFLYELNKQADKDGKSKFKFPQLLHGCHHRSLFSIAAPFSPKNPAERTAWSYALDKRLVLSNYETGKVLMDITTVGGIVYCMASSPLDPSRIAIGTGDNKVLVWNMSNDNVDNITTLWNKINSKVMAVAWHPVNESVLAYGTGEGRIGVFDVSKPNSFPKLFRQIHRRSVYSLIWAPPIVEISDRKLEFSLFSVGDGDILQYNPDTPDKDPINLSSYFKQCDSMAMVSKSVGRTDLAWNHDRSFAVVGNDNGVLYIVDGHTFNHVHTVFAHKKLVQCAVWHPATVTSEDSASPFCSWLASASDNIQIVNVTAAGVDIVACLNTHSEKVVSLAWSPHFNGRLISASYDYTSQVWDVPSGSVLACFDAHHSAVVCCLPSALHPDWVITGSADNTVRVWNINNFRLTKTKTKKQRLCGAMKKFSSAREATELTAGITEKFVDLHISENGDAPKVKRVEFADQKRKPKSMFPVTSSGLTNAKHLGLYWSRINGTEAINVDPGNSGYLDFFGDAHSMKRLAVVEGTYHRENNRASLADTFSLWSGDIAESIKEACKNKRLNEWLVSMAPMVSHKLWVDCCKCYAMQLAEVGDPLKAVSYYLSVHLVEEAVDVLLQAKLFKEAVCLAKLRLPRSDETVKNAVTEWANSSIGNGSLNLAAHCLLSTGANIEAVEVLSRSKDPEMLALASCIAVKAEANEMGLSLAMRALSAGLETQNYTLARKVCETHPALEDLAVWVDVCEMKTDWKPKDDKTVLTWINGKINAENKWNGIYEKAFEICKKKIPTYSVLLKFQPNKPTSESEHKIWIYIAAQICLAAAAQLQAEKAAKWSLKHLILALEAGYTFHLHNPSNPQFFLQLCLRISPWGPMHTDSWKSFSELTLLESFCSFLACGVIYWLDSMITRESLDMSDVGLMSDLNKIISRCAALLFHKDVLTYYKVEVDIKKLESAIASNKLKTLKAMKFCKDIEAELQSTGDPKPDEATTDKEDDSKKLARLKIQKGSFEDERLYTPNPFITFCTLRNVLEILGAKHPDHLNTLHEWKSIWDSASDEGNVV